MTLFTALFQLQFHKLKYVFIHSDIT